MPLQELHQLFLQSCMSRRVFSEQTGQAVFTHCWKATKGPDQRDEDAPSYSETIDEINSSIEAFGFQLKRFLDEYSGKAWTAFVNTKSDELAKVATEYTPQEISYFRTLIKLIMKSGDRYAILSNDAKSAGRSKSVRPELKLSEAERVLRSFVARGWLIATSLKVGRETKPTDAYQLSSRARMELEHYLVEQYPAQMDKDFQCKVCNEIVMKGVQCPERDCSMRMHDHCSRSYFASRREVCPVCESPWGKDHPRIIGPKAPAGAGVIASSDSEPEEDDEEAGEGGEEEGAEGSGTAAKRSSKSKSTGKGKGKAAATQGASDEEEDGGAMQEDAEEHEAARPSRRASGRQAPARKDQLADESEEEKHVPSATQEDDEDEEQDELQEDDDDEDDPMAARRALQRQKEQAKKKRKATDQSGR